MLVAAFHVPWNTKPAGIVPIKFCTKAVVATVVLSVAFACVTAVVAVFIVPLRSPKKVVAVADPATCNLVLGFDVPIPTLPPVSITTLVLVPIADELPKVKEFEFDVSVPIDQSVLVLK